MMKKKQLHSWRMIWIVATIPLVGLTLMAFSKPEEVANINVKTESTVTEQAAIPQLTLQMAEPGDIVKGCVKDQNGQPLENANIVEEDEFHRIVAHAVTDKNGCFSLKVVDPKHKIRISYVGFMSKTLEISGNPIDVELAPNLKINDVKVVGHAENINQNASRYKDQVLSNENVGGYDMVEQMPVFSGGMNELFAYLSQHLRYPSIAREMRVEADIVVLFTVDKTGFVRSPQVVNVTSQTPFVTDETMKAAKDGDREVADVLKNYNDAVEALKEEAIYVVRNMPRWEPGRQNGKRVDTTFTLPISFKLD